MLIFRLSVGLAQGLLLLIVECLYGDGKAPLPYLAVILPLVAVLTVVPLIVITGINNIKPRLLAAWGFTAAVVLTIVSLNFVARGVMGWQTSVTNDFNNGFPTLIATEAALFIAHSLVGAASAENKYIASYPAYFDAAWKLAVQAVLSAAFLGAFWLLVLLGVGLFEITGLHFFKTTIEIIWLPLSTVVTAMAIHITDVRPTIIQGVRNLKLALLSWLLPVIALITVMYLVSLCVTGLAPIWSTHYAAALFLATAFILIYTLNAAYEDGGAAQTQNKFLRRVGQVSALLLIPLVAIAVYDTGIRIRANGFTNDRFYLLAILIIVTHHTTGYVAAIFDRRGWMKRLEATNIAAAFVALGLYLLMFTPIADPVRLSVRDQIARLKDGRITPDKFDYSYLLDQGAGYGKAALDDLQVSGATPEIREHAKNFLHPEKTAPHRALPDEMARNFKVYPAGASVPKEFWRQQDWSQSNLSMFPDYCTDDGQCEAFVISNTASFSTLASKPGKIILSFQLKEVFLVFTQTDDGNWHLSGTYEAAFPCSGIVDAFRAGKFAFAPSHYSDLVVAGKHYTFKPTRIDTQPSGGTSADCP